MTKRVKSAVLHSTRVLISKKNKHRVVRNNTIKCPQNDKVLEKAGYRPTKVKKNCQRPFSRFLLVEAEAVEAEAIDEIAASASLF